MLPTVGSVNTSATDSFSHSNESASAGAYQVALANGVTTALTATPTNQPDRVTPNRSAAPDGITVGRRGANQRWSWAYH